MASIFKWLLVIPITILLIGTSMLLSNEIMIKKLYLQENTPNITASSLNRNQTRPTVKHSKFYSNDLKINRESVYPYFLLGTGLLLFLLVLPKLSELSFSPSNGFTLKVLQGAQEALEEATNAAYMLENQTKQATRATITTKPLSPILNEEISKLNASKIKLEAYNKLLKSRIN